MVVDIEEVLRKAGNILVLTKQRGKQKLVHACSKASLAKLMNIMKIMNLMNIMRFNYLMDPFPLSTLGAKQASPLSLGV